ncbi:MAG: methylated-DNA--[protein]-cysteine S-methyltransferase [Salinibacterium sp.]|nr:methylated-DNA--[protein]-cysteine S-methyltransferase [Salinibacterium sp.]
MTAATPTIAAPTLTITAVGTTPAFLRRVYSPLGRILVASDGESVTMLAIERDGILDFDDQPERTAPVLELAVSQLDEYFAGTRTDFDVPVAVSGTDFQKSVWKQLNLLPFGTVASYGEIGHATGRPTAGRAVGGAVGANPVPIIVPCHRVLATNGRITGFSAGNGIATKAWLLDHEGIEHRS